MSPEKANILIVEDDRDALELTTRALEGRGHHVVATATSSEDLESQIPSLGQKGVQVAIVDGNLTPGARDNSDGEKAAQDIKSAHPNIVIIGNASEGSIPSTDVDVGKLAGFRALAEVIKNA